MNKGTTYLLIYLLTYWYNKHIQYTSNKLK